MIKPPTARDDAASQPPVGGGVTGTTTNAEWRHTSSASADDAVLRLARLVGRRIARDQIERKQPSKPNPPTAIWSQESEP